MLLTDFVMKRKNSMKNYNVKNNVIVETATGNIVRKGEYSKLKETAKRLNGGFGFNGFTPAFFCIELPR